MRLKYKVLWFENDFDWFDSMKEDVEDLIKEYCFEPVITLHRKDSERNYKDYDLILMDLNLEDETTGDILIERIRQVDVYTDVLFYSADGLAKIKSRAQELGLEGVYFSSRERYVFLEKLKKVFLSTIYKVQDLNNLRGLVMAEVSELDVMMEDILRKYYIDKGDEEKIKIFHKHITSKVEDSIKNKLNPIDSCKKNCNHIWHFKEMDEILSDFDYDSSKKARSIYRIIIAIKYSYAATRQNFYEDYYNEIIQVRNSLAHCRSEVIDGKEYIKTKKKDEQDVLYDDDAFLLIRNNIKKYKSVFEQILENV